MKFYELNNGALFCFLTDKDRSLKLKLSRDSYYSFGVNFIISMKDVIGNDIVIHLGTPSMYGSTLAICNSDGIVITKVKDESNKQILCGMQFINENNEVFYISQVDSCIYKLMCYKTHNRVIDSQFSDFSTISDVISEYSRSGGLGTLRYKE